MTEVIYIYVACMDIKEARKIAGYCVTERLVASGNIYPNVESFYWWEGDVRSNTEVVLILKTMKRKFAEVEKAVKSLHSYECPCICAFPIELATKPYLDWIANETTE